MLLLSLIYKEYSTCSLRYFDKSVYNPLHVSIEKTIFPDSCIVLFWPMKFL